MDERKLAKLAKGEDNIALAEAAVKLSNVWPEVHINWNLAADIVLRSALKEYDDTRNT